MYSNIEDIYWNGVVASADKNGDKLEVRNQSMGSIQLVWSAAAATDAVVKLQESNDGTTWFDVATMTKTIGAATGSALWKLTKDILLSAYIRAVLTKNTETAAIITLKYFLKGN